MCNDSKNEGISTTGIFFLVTIDKLSPLKRNSTIIMTAITPTPMPCHPRHRLTSPNIKDSDNGRGFVSKIGERNRCDHPFNEPHQPSTPPRSMEHHLHPKRNTKQRLQHQYFIPPLSWECVIALTILGILTTAIMSIVVRTATVFRNLSLETSNVTTSMNLVSVSLSSNKSLTHYGKFHPTTIKNESISGQLGSSHKKLMVQTHELDNPNPKIVWLMSFPNSGTSFIIHMTREATNCTTATNYGLEGEIRDKPSVQAIQGKVGEYGPWLELLPTKVTRVADTILTKTHCKGFCSGSYCGADKTFHTTRSFMMGCLTGNQGVLSSKGGLRLTDKTYDRSLVSKAIHIFRHPLDNVVARFHLEYNEHHDAGNTKYVSKFPKDSTGFRRWCELDDQNRGLVRSRFIDHRLREFMFQIPCFNEFYRYTQWHNLAFETTRTMNITTMVLHYHEFSDDFSKARGRILNFLEQPLVGEGIDFDDGKVYRHYYSSNEKLAIRNFLQEFASTETWEQLKDYDFKANPIVTTVTSIQ